MRLIDLVDYRKEFERTYLTEMPVRLNQPELYHDLILDIESLRKEGIEPTEIKTGLMKISINDLIIYWYGDTTNVILGSEMHKHRNTLTILFTAKNPTHNGRKPFASDLYSDILDSEKNNLIVSDSQLSDEGFDIWKKLLSSGHKLSIYSLTEPGKTFKNIDNEEELKQYFGDDSKKEYRYVLSESGGDHALLNIDFRNRKRDEQVI